MSKQSRNRRLHDNKPEFLQTISQHCDKSAGEDAKKVNARVGSIFADNWADKAGNLKNNDEFAKSFENYLKNELEFAKHVITKGVDKPGTVGECLIMFELE